MLSYIKNANIEFSLWFGSLLSWPFWMPVLLIGSFLGLALGRNDAVMVILTIQTSIDAQATKMLQNHLRALDERRDAQILATVESTKALADEVRQQNALIIDLMRAAEKRDRIAAKRDRMMLVALEARNDLLDFLRKEDTHNDRARKTRRTNSGQRTAHGRRDRKKS